MKNPNKSIENDKIKTTFRFQINKLHTPNSQILNIRDIIIHVDSQYSSSSFPTNIKSLMLINGPLYGH